jgi:glycosyltransferase involved in cell wall biosynthesis
MTVSKRAMPRQILETGLVRRSPRRTDASTTPDMHVGFVHPKMLSEEGVGSTHSASKLVYELADRGHRVTVYCPDDSGTAVDETPRTDSNVIVEILDIDEGFSRLPERKFAVVGECIRERASEFESFDVVHSYVSGISWLADLSDQISAPVVTTLNAYDAACPKGDLFYKDSEPCQEMNPSRCAECILASTIAPDRYDVYDGASVYDEYDGLQRPAATAYLLAKRFRSLRAVRDIKDRADGLDAYHVLADHLRETYVDMGFPADRFRTIPNILDERFLVSHRSDFSEPYRLLSVGSLVRRKGVQRLIPMMEALEGDDAEYELTVVGNGYLESTLREAAAETDATVSVTGRISYDDLPRVYAAHDTFVYPGIWEEPFGRVFLEALATGTPVVTSPVGAAGTIIDGAGVVTDGSVEGLAAGVRELTDREDLDAVSARAKQRAREFSPDRVVPQFERLYADLLDRPIPDETPPTRA